MFDIVKPKVSKLTAEFISASIGNARPVPDLFSLAITSEKLAYRLLARLA